MRLSLKEARRLGIEPSGVPSKNKPPRGRNRPGKRNQAHVTQFELACKAHGLPAPIGEYEFCPGRKWRFDWLFAEIDLVLEVQGGIFSQGRHTRGAALLKEHEKLNYAAILGYRVMFCTPEDIEKGSIFPLIKAAFEENCLTIRE